MSLRVTERGLAFGALGAIALGTGVALGSLVTGAVGLSLLSTLALAWATTRAPTLAIERRVSADSTREDAPLRVEVRVRVGAGAARVEVEDVVPPTADVVAGSPRASGRVVTLEHDLAPRAPGALRLRDVRARYTDALGLVEGERIAADERVVEVYPRHALAPELLMSSRRAASRSGQNLVGQQGAGSDFFALREYQPGDTMRDVNWRASARMGSGKLVVNQREMESPADVLWMLDARGAALAGDPRASGWAESLRALANLGPDHVKRRDRLRIVAYGGDARVLVEGRAGDPQLAQALKPLLAHEPGGDVGLRGTVESLVPTLRRRSAVVIATNARDDPTLADGIAALRALDVDVTVLLCGAEPGADALVIGASRVARWGGARA